MGMTEEDFNAFAQQLAKLNGLDPDLAGDYAARIGDTPFINEDGLVEVRDHNGNLMAELIMPYEDSDQ